MKQRHPIVILGPSYGLDRGRSIGRGLIDDFCRALVVAHKWSKAFQMEIDLLKAKLNTLKADLQRRLSAIDADLSLALDSDSAERAVQVENDDVLREMQKEGAEQIAAIDAALARMDNGAYGICVKCQGEIGTQRLAAIPYTPFCIECAKTLA